MHVWIQYFLGGGTLTSQLIILLIHGNISSCSMWDVNKRAYIEYNFSSHEPFN